MGKKAKDNVKHKEQTKNSKLEAKRLAQEAKKNHKEQLQKAKEMKAAQKAELKQNLSGDANQLDSKKITQETRTKVGVKKPKKEHEKGSFKQATREFPVKMIKEVNKIKWSGPANLTKKYITVLLFMAVFAIVFFFIDWGLQALFALMKVV